VKKPISLRLTLSDLSQAGRKFTKTYNGKPDAKPVKQQIRMRRLKIDCANLDSA
jgi:hypothetical protein